MLCQIPRVAAFTVKPREFVRQITPSLFASFLYFCRPFHAFSMLAVLNDVSCQPIASFYPPPPARRPTSFYADISTSVVIHSFAACNALHMTTNQSSELPLPALAPRAQHLSQQASSSSTPAAEGSDPSRPSLSSRSRSSHRSRAGCW